MTGIALTQAQSGRQQHAVWEEDIVHFRLNQIIAKNQQGKKGIGIGLVYPSAEAIEIIGMLGGFDFVNLDGEHGLFSPESIDAMCRVADGFGLTVTARVPNIRPSTINLFLDRGVTGILGPHIETAEDAQALVDACRFVPDGQRSWGGGRGTYYNSTRLLDVPGSERTEFMQQANANMLVMGQLETTRAFANLDAILEVPGIDAFAWGPNDLAQSMGLPGGPQHPDVLAAQRQVADRIHAAGRKLNSDIMAALNLPELIVNGAQQFLADNT
jgi:4-hydroxy-2-oxoheptanedioate aldolase